MEQVCPSCKTPISPTTYFCPNCGKKIKDPPPSTTIGKQIGLYIFSVIAPPFGLIPAFKYLKQPDQKAKNVGIAAIILTILSLIITVWYTIGFINTFNKTLNSEMNVPGLNSTGY